MENWKLENWKAGETRNLKAVVVFSLLDAFCIRPPCLQGTGCVGSGGVYVSVVLMFSVIFSLCGLAKVWPPAPWFISGKLEYCKLKNWKLETEKLWWCLVFVMFSICALLSLWACQSMTNTTPELSWNTGKLETGELENWTTGKLETGKWKLDSCDGV